MYYIVLWCVLMQFLHPTVVWDINHKKKKKEFLYLIVKLLMKNDLFAQLCNKDESSVHIIAISVRHFWSM